MGSEGQKIDIFGILLKIEISSSEWWVDPSEADPGTIRADFAETIDANAVHGSDSVESASREISYFFDDSEIF